MIHECDAIKLERLTKSKRRRHDDAVAALQLSQVQSLAGSRWYDKLHEYIHDYHAFLQEPWPHALARELTLLQISSGYYDFLYGDFGGSEEHYPYGSRATEFDGSTYASEQEAEEAFIAALGIKW